MLGTELKMKVSLGRWQCESCSEFAANLYSRPLHPILDLLSTMALPIKVQAVTNNWKQLLISLI